MDANTWADKISDLEAIGWSLTGIGDAITLSPQSLSDIKQGRSKEPRGMAAVKLHALHESKLTPEQWKAVSNIRSAA